MSGLHRRLWLVVGLGLAALAAGGASAKELRYSGQSAIPSMDPAHSVPAEVFAFLSNIYEPLVDLNEQGQAVPNLAVSWSQIEPTRWRFKLRQGVKFHDGDTFDADDVVFSVTRQLSKNASSTQAVKNVVRAEKVDDYTVDIVTKDSDILQPQTMYALKMMSKQWSEKNNAVGPAPKGVAETNYAMRNANGTGPFALVANDPGVSATLQVNRDWWGGKRTDQLTSAKYVVITSAATAVAALLSGDIDLVSSLNPAAVERLQSTKGYKVVSESGLVTVYIGLDDDKDELQYSNVKGKNPFRDVRVRKAMDMAIDRQQLVDRVYRGFGAPAGMIFFKWIPGYTADLGAVTKPDPDAAKKLLAETGYPDGFTVQFDCPQGIWLNDQALCQAISIMLSKIGINAELKAYTGTTLNIKMTQTYDTSMFLYTWATSSFDAIDTASSLLHTRDKSIGMGLSNVSGWSNKDFDAGVEKVRKLGTIDERLKGIHDIYAIYRRDLPMLPLTYEPVIWAMKDNVDIKANPLNRIYLSRLTFN